MAKYETVHLDSDTMKHLNEWWDSGNEYPSSTVSTGIKVRFALNLFFIKVKQDRDSSN